MTFLQDSSISSITDVELSSLKDLGSLIVGVSENLKDLENLDEIIVHKTEGLCEINNKYELTNNQNTKVFLAVENSISRLSTYISKFCCRQIVEFQLKISNASGNEIIQLHHPDFTGWQCCSDLQRMEVFSPPGNLIGIVQQEHSDHHLMLHLCNRHEKPLLILKGYENCNCQKFQIMLPDARTRVGKIVNTTRWGFSNQYKVTFKKELGVKGKAMILGACFLIVLICQLLKTQQ